MAGTARMSAPAIVHRLRGPSNGELSHEASRLPYPSGHFTLVRVVDVLQRLPRSTTKRAVAEWIRVLHPNGMLLIAGPDLASYEDDIRAAGHHHVRVGSVGESETWAGSMMPTSWTLLASRALPVPHSRDEPLGESDFRARGASFRAAGCEMPPVSYVVPVFDEERRLAQFLSFLEGCRNETRAEREFLFVLNGCTDRSEEIVRRWLEQTYLKAHIVTSEKGILQAYRAGIAARRLDGWIGKLDADVVLHPHVLDLMEMHLTLDPRLQVTYAEPMPLDAHGPFNRPDHEPELLSKRLYFTSKASISRCDTFSRLDALGSSAAGIMAEDIFLSFYHGYFHGLESIGRAPNAIVYAQTVGDFADLVGQVSRARSDIERLFRSYPPFTLLGEVFRQEIFDADLELLMRQAEAEAAYVDDWTRLPTTK